MKNRNKYVNEEFQKISFSAKMKIYDFDGKFIFALNMCLLHFI